MGVPAKTSSDVGYQVSLSPSSVRRVVLVLLSPLESESPPKSEQTHAEAWADANGFEILDQVVEPFHVNRGSDPTTWKELQRAVSLAKRIGAPNLVLAGLREDSQLTPFHFELLKARILRQHDLLALHTESSQHIQQELTAQLVAEVQGLARDQRTAVASAVRRRQKSKGTWKRGGRKPKELTPAEIQFLRENYKSGKKGHGVDQLAQEINRRRGLPPGTPLSKLHREGVGATYIFNKVRELGLAKKPN